MTDRRLTDLPELTLANITDDDLFYTVDPNDPTDNPAGSSFKATLGNIAVAIEGIHGDVPNGFATLDGAGKLKSNQTQSADIVPNVPSGSVTATNVQDAINQLESFSSGVFRLVGNWDASTGQFPSSTAKQGDTYLVSVGGTVDGVIFEVNDKIAAIIDNPSLTVYAGNWIKFNNKGDYTASDITNVPSGNISSVNVQDAIDELDSEKVDKSTLQFKGSLLAGNGAGGVIQIPPKSDGSILLADSTNPTGWTGTQIPSQDIVFSQSFDGSSDITVYDGLAMTVRYNAAELQFQFRPNTPLSDCATSILMNINNQVRDRTDDFPVVAGTWYYFSGGINKANSFNMQSLGVQLQMHVSKEVRQIGVPSIFIQCGAGNPDNLWAVVTVLETTS